MTAVEPYRGADVTLPSVIPDAARAIVEWATSADAAYTLAQKLVATSFCPQAFRGKPAEAAAAILAGAEVNLSPMAALRAFDVIQGVAAPRALTIRAIAQGQGHAMVVEESTPRLCRMRGRRRGEAEWQSVEWTIERAGQLGLLGKDQWKKQPATMLVARATTELGRLIAADSLLGIGYSIEELSDESPESTTTVTRTASPQAPRRTVARKARPEVEAPALEPAAPPQDPEAATRAQIDRLRIGVESHLGSLERDARLDWASAYLGREVTSFTDLTRAEAARLIDHLEAPPLDVQDPPGWDEGSA